MRCTLSPYSEDEHLNEPGDTTTCLARFQAGVIRLMHRLSGIASHCESLTAQVAYNVNETHIR
jgi:hypothetical protein